MSKEKMSKMNLSGQRFGKLLVLEQIQERKYGHVKWLCQCDCGQFNDVFSTNLTSGDTKSCGCLHREIVSDAMKGELNPNWNGGRRKHDGYILVLSPNHPYAQVDGYVREHRLVMEKKIGRYLLPEEVVHHDDENKANNKPENLRLFKNDVEHRRYERDF